MNIKIEHTKTHKTTTYNNKTFGGILMEVNTLVTDAELILVECNPKQGDVFITSNEMAKKLPFNADKNVPFKPILISITEKVEVGDWVYNPKHPMVKIFQFKENDPWKDSPRHGGWFKILGLSEHFSLQSLQDIVDGKLKEGKCLVECIQEEPIPMTYKGVDSRGDYLYYCPKCGHGGSYMGTGQVHCYKDECRPTTIKLNPHITIYNVERKTYTFEDMDEIRRRAIDFGASSLSLNKWFKKIVK